MRVNRVGFAAVKGARHLTLPEVHLTGDGVERDRWFALAEPTTHRVLRTVQHPQLGRVVATVNGDQLTLRLPDGAEVSGSTARVGPRAVGDYWGRPAGVHRLDGALDEWVSMLVGRPAVVVGVDPGHAVWGAPVSVITTGALARLEAVLRAADREVPADLAERFRSNLILDASSDPVPGQRLGVGSAVIEVVGPIDRCAVVDADPATGRRRSGVLTALGSGAPTFGVDARVIESGTVRPGDPVDWSR